MIQYFVEAPDLGPGTFLGKLKGQLSKFSDSAIQLAAELQYLTVLPLSNMKPEKKRDRVQQILSWMTTPVAIPGTLSAALDGSVFSGGMGFSVQGWKQFEILIRFVALWTGLDRATQTQYARDPWAFRDFLMTVPGPSPAAQRYELMYLAFPDTFEPIVNHEHRRRIRDAFADLIGGATADIDRDLFEIRRILEERSAQPVEFYQTPYVEKWKPAPTQPTPKQAPRGRRAWLIRASEELGASPVSVWLTEGFVSLGASRLPRLPQANDADDAIQNMVTENYSHLSYSQRDQLVDELSAFLRNVREDDIVATTDRDSLYLGEITGSVDQATEPGELRRRVKWLNPDAGIDISELSGSLAARLQSPGDLVELTAELSDLEGLMVEAGPPTKASLTLPDATAELAEELLLPRAWLQECIDLLRDRPQLIFYGPPGTGKTFIAQHLAWHLAGREGTTLVQFHPAYSYEDFFEGFRPRSGNAGTISFELRPGPFRRVVDQAARHPGQPFVLVIDEINRGNLARIFGELYFLLEYRDSAIELLYASGEQRGVDRAFTLPENVFIIGTMNTTDRSIALVDTAMRRRFSFVPLRPDTPPIADLLGKWLRRGGLDERPAKLLQHLNSMIGDPEFAIGPSYFMRPAVHQPGGLERAWRTSILPLLEEHHYGDEVDVGTRYSLEKLLHTIDGTGKAASTGTGPDPDASSDETASA